MQTHGRIDIKNASAVTDASRNNIMGHRRVGGKKGEKKSSLKRGWVNQQEWFLVECLLTQALEDAPETRKDNKEELERQNAMANKKRIERQEANEEKFKEVSEETFR